MRRLVLVLLALALGTSGLSATDKTPADKLEPRVVEPLKPAAPATLPKLDRIAVEKRASTDEVTASQLPARGSFWWLVGVIVVAGVILAVLL